MGGLAVTDPFYHSPAWRRLRAAALRRDGRRCAVPGCGARATHVDHVVSRRRGGADALHNLRSLCAHHDAALKELPSGKRRRDGKAIVRGCRSDGTPIDPSHWWNRS